MLSEFHTLARNVAHFKINSEIVVISKGRVNNKVFVSFFTGFFLTKIVLYICGTGVKLILCAKDSSQKAQVGKKMLTRAKNQNVNQDGATRATKSLYLNLVRLWARAAVGAGAVTLS